MSNIEGAANTVLDGFENGTLDFSDEDSMVKLVTFLHTLSARTMKPRSMMQRIHEQTVPILQQFAKNTDPSVAVYCNSTDDEYAKKLQIEQLLDPIQTAKFGVKLLENYNWYMGIVQSDIKLIISDNPTQMIDLGFNDCCFPISPDKAIIFRVKQKGAPMISEDAPENGVINLSAKSVLVYNLLQKGQAERFLFGDKTSIDVLLATERVSKVLLKRHNSDKENEQV